MVTGQFSAIPALAIQPNPAPAPEIDITQLSDNEGHTYQAPFPAFDCDQYPLYGPITISGGGVGSAHPGQIEQYHIQVDWGDGNITNGLGTFLPPIGQGNFQFIFTGGPHTYAINGSYTIKARLYHVNPPGNDGQADAVASLAICIHVEPPVCTDNDQDDYYAEGGDCGPTDCNDGDAAINPDATELCDGLDNDCDNTTDEDFANKGQTCTNGQGVCEASGQYVCTQDGLGTECNATPGTPATETCDNLDNNCDGQVDEDLTQPTNCGVGICSSNTGIETCTAGIWGGDTCDPLQGAGTEVCDGSLDENCNGSVDEGCQCTNGQTQSCGPATDAGECVFGAQTCADGAWGAECIGAIYPVDETCDNLDNNCDGNIDEDLTQLTFCGVGVCSGNTGIETCGAGAWGGDTCDPLQGAGVESCNNLDDDCDGSVDEDLTQPTNCGVGICANNTGAETCTAGAWGGDTCDPFQGALVEICGNGIDEDCNGSDLLCDLVTCTEATNGVTCDDYLYDDYCEIITGGDQYANTRICNAPEGPSCSTLVGVTRTLCPHGCSNGACIDGPECTDTDQDGFAVEGDECGPIDCDDSDELINPDATENCSDQVDNNCDGLIDGEDEQSCPPERVCDPDVELITNGSFETPVVTNPSGWDIFPVSLTSWITNWFSLTPDIYNEQTRPAEATLELQKSGLFAGLIPEGNQYSELDGDWGGPNGSGEGEPASVKISQDLLTAPGYQYLVTFNFSPRPDTLATNNILNFSWNNALQDSISRAGGSSFDWSSHSYLLAASGYNTRVEFADAGTADSLGTFLDNVSVRCIPEIQCTPGETGPCETGQPGICAGGTKTCDQYYQWGDCVSNEEPIEEICDNESDDDCDSLTDIQDPECQSPVDQGSICGYKFNDLDQDGIFNNNDYGIAEWVFRAQKGESTLLETSANPNGYYCFNGLTAGNWTVYELMVNGWTPTTDATATVPLAENQGIPDVNFGNVQCINNDGDTYAQNGGLICGPTDCNDNPEGGEGINPGAAEICDDQIDNNCDGLTDSEDTSACPPAPVCGNGIKEGDEQCDGTAGVTTGYLCTTQCTLEQIISPVCGDQSCNGAETCSTCVADCGSCGGGGGGGGGGSSTTSLIIHTIRLARGQEAGSVIMTWFTNKAATSRVVYDNVSHPLGGTPPNYGYQWSTGTIDTDPKITFHIVTITGLLPATVYYFRPISAASPEVYGEEVTFTTEEAPPAEIPPIEVPPTEETPAPTPPAPQSPTPAPANEEGTVAGVEFAEAATIPAEEQPAPELTAEVPPSQEPAAEEALADCSAYIWLLAILNLIVAAILGFRGKKNKGLVKYSWVVYALIVLILAIIWYPQCWLITWLVALLLAGIIYLIILISTSNSHSDQK